DFFGGTRTVDVHVRRLRAKLGPEHNGLIGTVRSVGYKFILPPRGRGAERGGGAERGRRENGVIGAEETGETASPDRAPAAERPDRAAAERPDRAAAERPDCTAAPAGRFGGATDPRVTDPR